MKTARAAQVTLIAAAGALLHAAANKLQPASPAAVNYPKLVSWLRSNLADACDQRNALEATNLVLRQGIVKRDAELTAAQAELTRAADSIASLLRALNAANVRCAEMQQALKHHGIVVESAYFLATLSDGTVAGPFGRN